MNPAGHLLVHGRCLSCPVCKVGVLTAPPGKAAGKPNETHQQVTGRSGQAAGALGSPPLLRRPSLPEHRGPRGGGTREAGPRPPPPGPGWDTPPGPAGRAPAAPRACAAADTELPALTAAPARRAFCLKSTKQAHISWSAAAQPGSLSFPPRPGDRRGAAAAGKPPHADPAGATRRPPPGPRPRARTGRPQPPAPETPAPGADPRPAHLARDARDERHLPGLARLGVPGAGAVRRRLGHIRALTGDADRRGCAAEPAAGTSTARPAATLTGRPEAGGAGRGRGGRDAARRAPRGRVTARRSAQPAGLRPPRPQAPPSPTGPRQRAPRRSARRDPPTPSGLRPQPKAPPHPAGAPPTPPGPRSPGGAGLGAGSAPGAGRRAGPRGLVQNAGRRRVLGLRALVRAGSGPGGLSATWTCPSHAARPPLHPPESPRIIVPRMLCRTTG